MALPRYVFIGGLHKSGTSILHRVIREHPSISGFSDTGVHQDEGQLLQSVYPPASAHGGWGRFGFDEAAHLVEPSGSVIEASRQRLLSEWESLWDESKSIRVEKSPPNLIRTRYLQALFPDSRFVIIMRHPVSVTLGSLKWAKRSVKRVLKGRTIVRLIHHWVRCHEILEEDAPHLRHLLVVKYEHLVTDPTSTLERIYEFIGVRPTPPTRAIRGSLNEDRYFSPWRSWQRSPFMGGYLRWTVSRWEDDVRHFGYSLHDLAVAQEWQPTVDG